MNAPSGSPVTDYDRRNLALYAALLEADDTGRDWRDAAADLMHLDVTYHESEECWRSHLERARWIVGNGMANAIVAFGVRPGPRAHNKGRAPRPSCDRHQL